ncbi:MAG: cysteine--tRNA ligase [bacterium]|nr:cysteine--tRNA ligase [bacterium]
MAIESIRLYNTLTRKKEVFKPIRKDRVGLYTCGPTVYNFAHIGNLRTYIFEDILRRTLEYAKYDVRHVMNITDVGHLTSDADTGEDKLEKEAAHEGKTVWDIARFYTDAFTSDIARLNIKKAKNLVPATRTIENQIALIHELFKKKYAYETTQAVYFHVPKFKRYTRLSRQKLNEKIIGAREKVITDPEKKHPADFVLWFKSVGKFKNHVMRWPSPWSEGFPGWHIECSAISTKYLGQPFDIHTGGIDHINVHHTNEIAQSEAAFEKPLAKYWMHGEFLLIDAAKMAKSEKNFITLNTVIQKGFNPLAFRYLVLTAHYRSKLNFTWKSLESASHSLEKLYEFIRELKTKKGSGVKKSDMRMHSVVEKEFRMSVFSDLDTAGALVNIWDLVRAYHKNPEAYNPKTILDILYDFDKILGLGFKNVKSETIPAPILKLAMLREQYRKNKKWEEADKMRQELQKHGYTVEDTPEGPRVKRV